MIDDRIKAAFEVGRSQWPTVRDIAIEAFGAFIEDAVVDPDVLGDRAGDLYIAAAAVGRGPLGAWIRVAGMRVALDICDADSPIAQQLKDPDSLLLDSLDPEQALVRKKYGTLFATALRDAVAQLSKRDRTLLRFHYVAGMSYDAMGRAYHVHRATVVRWLASIRDELDTAVRIRLWKELGVSPSEFRSLWNAVKSEVEVSLSRLLVGPAHHSTSSP